MNMKNSRRFVYSSNTGGGGGGDGGGDDGSGDGVDLGPDGADGGSGGQYVRAGVPDLELDLCPRRLVVTPCMTFS